MRVQAMSFRANDRVRLVGDTFNRLLEAAHAAGAYPPIRPLATVLQDHVEGRVVVTVDGMREPWPFPPERLAPA